jgi:hypothetical protein
MENQYTQHVAGVWNFADVTDLQTDWRGKTFFFTSQTDWVMEVCEIIEYGAILCGAGIMMLSITCSIVLVLSKEVTPQWRNLLCYISGWLVWLLNRTFYRLGPTFGVCIFWFRQKELVKKNIPFYLNGTLSCFHFLKETDWLWLLILPAGAPGWEFRFYWALSGVLLFSTWDWNNRQKVWMLIVGA